MIALSDQIVADGGVPWCIENGFWGDGPGYTAAHWLGDILRRTVSPAEYEQWLRGELKFDSPQVRQAFELLADIWFAPGYAFGGRETFNDNTMSRAETWIFTNPPKCWLLKEPSWGVAFDGSSPYTAFNYREFGKDYDFFMLPPFAEGATAPLQLEGHLLAMFHDRPEVRALLQYVASGAAAEAWVKLGTRAELSAHKNANPAWSVQAREKAVAEAVQNAGDQIFLSPNAIFSTFQREPYVSISAYIDGSIDLDTALQQIDAAWPDMTLAPGSAALPGSQDVATGYDAVQPEPPPGELTVLVEGAQIRSPNGIKVGPDGNLYVASAMAQAILVLDPDTGEIIERLGPEVGVDIPDDLAFGPDGSIYWTDFFRGTVGRLAPDGTTSSQMVAPGVNPIAVAPDGRVFVALAFLGDALYELDPELAGPPQLLAEGLGGLNSFEFGADGKLYAPVMDKGEVVRIDVDSDPIQVETVAAGLEGPIAVKFDAQGNLFAMAPPGIVRIDMETGAVEPVATILYGTDNFAIDDQDRFFVSLITEGTIAEVMADDTLRMLGATGLVLPGGLAVLPQADGDGEVVYLGDFWMLRTVDGTTGAVLADPLGIPGGTVAADGENLVLTNYVVNVVAVWNPQTGEMLATYFDFAVPLNAIRFQGDLVVVEAGANSVVRADGADPTQLETIAADLTLPAGLATDGENLWVSDWGAGKVWQIIADGAVLEEPKLIAEGLEQPEGMALAPDGRLLVVETGAGRLAALDLATGAVSSVAEGLSFDTVAPEGQPPTGLMSSVAVGPSGAIYVTADEANVLYRFEPVE